MNPLKKTVQALIIGGFLPFLLLAMCSIVLKEHTIILERAFTIYSIVIVCSFATSQWLLLHEKSRYDYTRQQTNLIPWLAITSLSRNPLGSHLTNMVCYLWLLYLERILFLNQITKSWYFHLRKNTNIAVILTLLFKIIKGLI